MNKETYLKNVPDTNTKAYLNQRLLLIMTPYHPPLMPPLGMACLKAKLQENGFYITTRDFNVNTKMRTLYYDYFLILDKKVPKTEQGNFYNIGNELLRQHLMIYINKNDEGRYNTLLKDIIYRTFYIKCDGILIHELNNIVVNMYMVFEKLLIDEIEKEKPDIVGFSTVKGTLPISIYSTRIIKKINKNIITLIGGGIFADQFSLGSEDLINFVNTVDTIDNFFVGEGELMIVEYLKNNLPPNQKIYSLKDINFNLLDLNHAPEPDFSDFDINLYSYLPTYSSRSCPFHCKFCGETVNWGKYRKKAIKNTIDEISALSNKYNKRIFFLCDSLLNPIISSLTEELINRKLNIHFDGYLRADENITEKANAQCF